MSHPTDPEHPEIDERTSSVEAASIERDDEGPVGAASEDQAEPEYQAESPSGASEFEVDSGAEMAASQSGESPTVADSDDEESGDGADSADDDDEAVAVASLPVAPVSIAAAPAEASSGSSGAAATAEADEPRRWYVLKVQSNRERTIKDSLLRRIRRDGLEQFFGDIVIPTEKVVETKNGKKRTTERKLYPGYIMINMVLNDETWYLVRDTGGVGDFTGAAGKPLPMRDEEIAAMIRQGEEKPDEQPKVKIMFAGGDAVKIKEGTFENFEGTVEKVDEASGKINVLIEIFGRPTPVELEYWQVERM